MHPIWIIKEQAGPVIVRVYVDRSPAALYVKGFCDTDPDLINRDEDPSNPLINIAPTLQRINDTSSPLIAGLGKNDLYTLELRAAAFNAGSESVISHAVLQNNSIVPAIVDNNLANRTPSGTYRAVSIGKAKHAATASDVLAFQFSIDAI